MRGFIGAQTDVARLVFPMRFAVTNQYQAVGFSHYSRRFLGNAELPPRYGPPVIQYCTDLHARWASVVNSSKTTDLLGKLQCGGCTTLCKLLICTGRMEDVWSKSLNVV